MAAKQNLRGLFITGSRTTFKDNLQQNCRAFDKKLRGDVCHDSPEQRLQLRNAHLDHDIGMAAGGPHAA